MVLKAAVDEPASEASATTYTADGRSFGKKAKAGEADVPRLVDAMRAARRTLRYFREQRVNAIRQYVGRNWSDWGSDKRVPVNLLARYVQVVARALVPNNPRVMLSTQKRSAQPAVRAMQDWMNQRIVDTKFQQTLHRWTVDGLFGLGIMKTGIATPADAASAGYTTQAGVPFSETVDLDDFVYDIGCKDFRQASFLGHRYRMPLDVAESLKYFDAKERKKLGQYAVPNDARMNQDDGDERVNVVGMGWQHGAEREYEPMVDLWEIYIPRLRKVITMASSAGGVPNSDCGILREQEWIGPDCGPYHFLAFQLVPGNAMPKAPVQDLIDLHEFVNHGYRKLINQMQRQKSVLPVSGAAVDDSKNIQQASDGEIIGCDRPEGVKEVSYGGPNTTNANFVVHLTDVFSKQAGNLELLAGTQAQSKTATQDKILAENSSAGVADMQETATSGFADVLRAHCWFWWYHPTEVMNTSRSAPGLPDIAIERKLYPGGYRDPNTGTRPDLARDGRFEELMCRIDPYSLVYRTPQQRLGFITQVVQSMVPMLPILQQQGVMFDAQAYLKKISEYADEPDIVDLFTVSAPPSDGQGAGGGHERTLPGSTSREYTRKSEAQPGAQQAADFENDNLAAAASEGE